MKLPLLPEVFAYASLSPCETYRYRLDRVWDDTLPIAGWVMLNPSTATAEEDDWTIRRIQEFSRRWGMGGALVCNVFALRSTDPKALLAHPDPVGPLNDVYLDDLALDPTVQVVIAAWGVHATLHGRDQAVRELFAFHGRKLDCLGVTKEGHPRHPRGIRDGTEPKALWPESRPPVEVEGAA
jgi:hypothetical protein